MKTGEEGIKLIKQFEGCSLKAYPDPGTGKLPYTIGYGNTYYEDSSKVKLGDVITQARADLLLKNLLPKYEDIVDSKIKIDISQNAFDALVSYTWNTGGSDTLFKLVNAKSSEQAIRTWFTTKYITGGGKELPGLVKRRHAEADLFFKK